MNLLFAYLYGGSEFQIIEALSLRNSYFLKVQHLDDKERCFAIEFKSSATPLVITMPQYIPIDFINSIIQFIKQKNIHMLYMVDIMTFSSTLSCMEKKSVNFLRFVNYSFYCICKTNNAV